MDEKFRSECLQKGIDLDEILEGFPDCLLDKSSAFTHVVRNLLNVIPMCENQEESCQTKTYLTRYIELLREFPDFQAEQLRPSVTSYDHGTPLKDFIDSEFERLRKRKPE